MKIEITQTPKITYNKVVYMFKAKIEDDVYDAIENLFFHDDFDYITVKAGETLEVEG